MSEEITSIEKILRFMENHKRKNQGANKSNNRVEDYYSKLVKQLSIICSTIKSKKKEKR